MRMPQCPQLKRFFKTVGLIAFFCRYPDRYPGQYAGKVSRASRRAIRLPRGGGGRIAWRLANGPAPCNLNLRSGGIGIHRASSGAAHMQGGFGPRGLGPTRGAWAQEAWAQDAWARGAWARRDRQGFEQGSYRLGCGRLRRRAALLPAAARALRFAVPSSPTLDRAGLGWCSWSGGSKVDNCSAAFQ
jgi:hypothetical protein